MNIPRAILIVGLLSLFGCPDQRATAMDAMSTPSPDGGVPSRIVLERANLTPAGQTAQNERHVIRGHLRQSSGHDAENQTKRIRGGLVPLTR